MFNADKGSAKTVVLVLPKRDFCAIIRGPGYALQNVDAPLVVQAAIDEGMEIEIGAGRFEHFVTLPQGEGAGRRER